MTTEPPECCIKYDSLSAQIYELEAEIEYLTDEIEPKTEKIKEYLQILKDAKEVCIYPVLYKIEAKEDLSIDCNPVLNSHVSYFEKKIQEFNDDLLRIDETLKKDEETLVILRKELEETEIKVRDMGWKKIQNVIPLSTNIVEWVTTDEALLRKNKNPLFTHIIF